LQMADEPHLPGGAKDASHGAAGLGADARGVAARITHEDGLDRLTIGEGEEEFAGLAIGTGDLGAHGREIGGKAFAAEPLADPAAERGQKILAGGEIGRAVAVQGAPESAGVNGTQAIGDQLALDRGETQIMDGTRHGRRRTLP